MWSTSANAIHSDYGVISKVFARFVVNHKLFNTVIYSQISKEGVSVISDQAKEKLHSDFKDLLAAGAEV